MRFGVLGPLSVQAADGAELVLPGTGPRVTLAVLLVHANRAVPVDTLVEAVWHGSPPRSWASNIQTYISRLRHALPGLDDCVTVLPDVHFKRRNPSPTGTVVVSRSLLVPRAVDPGSSSVP